MEAHPLKQQSSLAAVATAGALGGLALAFDDFGAEWLWLDRAQDRVGLLLGLLRLHAFSGALLAAGVTTFFRLARWLVALVPYRGIRARNAIFTNGVALAPVHSYFGTYLLERPMVAAVPGAPWLVWSAVVASFVGSQYLLTTATIRLARPPRPWLLGAALHGLAAGISKLDQLCLPGYYEALHGLLTATAFAAHWAGFHCWLRALGHGGRRLAPKHAMSTCAAGSVLLLVLGHAFADRYQNVRIAMTHPRASHSHSLTLAVSPLLSGLDHLVVLQQQRQAHRAHRAYRQTTGSRLAPRWPLAHVLVITIDALRADHLGCYGYKRPTSPYLDQLARSAWLFERAYTTAPHSSHALSSLWTGQAVHARILARSSLPARTLPALMAEAGYHTAAFFIDGIFYTDRSAFERYADRRFDFNRYDQTPRNAEALTDAVLGEMTRTVARGEPSSLFWAHYFDVHAPYRRTRFGHQDIDRYDSEIAYVDAALRRLIDGARARLHRNLLVVITADHGEAFGEHGQYYHGSALYDEQTRVPLVVQGPDLAPRRVSDSASLIDLGPTILNSVGIPVPDDLPGRDLLSEPARAPAAVSTVGYKRAVVRYPHKLIHEPRWSTLELYNIQRDPGERRNLADERPQLTAKMRALLSSQLPH